MSDPEDVVSWLQKKLRAEQVVMREQHRRMYEYMESQHTQVLAEMERKLSQGLARQASPCSKQSSTAPEQPALNPPEDDNLNQPASKKERSPSLLNNLDQDHVVKATSEYTVTRALHSAIELSTPKLSNEISQSTSPDRYKHHAIKRLAGGSFLLETKPLFQRLVESPLFEIVCGIVILMNTIILAFEIEYHGFDSGHAVNYKGYETSKQSWPGADIVFEVLDIIFVSVFTIELVIRVAAAGSRFVYSAWIWFDFVIIAISWFGISPATLPADTVDPTVMRVARLARMMRTFKMVRAIKLFDSLYVLLKSIQASVGALFWSFALLMFVQVACGLGISQLLQGYILDESEPLSERRKVFLYYGTFSRTMITMFEISLVNWSVSCRLLMDNVSEWYGLFYILYVCCFIFAVIRVIQAVFIAETNRVVAADDQIAIRRKEQEKTTFLSKLHIMFEELDKSGDGKVTYDELQHLCEDKLLKSLMSTLGVTVHDIESLFKLLENGNGEIAIDDFTRGLSRCKGMAQGLDLVILGKMTKTLDEKIDRVLDAFGHEKVVTSWRTSKKLSGVGFSFEDVGCREEDEQSAEVNDFSENQEVSASLHPDMGDGFSFPQGDSGEVDCAPSEFSLDNPFSKPTGDPTSGLDDASDPAVPNWTPKSIGSSHKRIHLI